MESSTAERTAAYIAEHPHIKSCLKRGLINYSALARLIIKDLGIQNKSSKEAVLIAARRYQQQLRKENLNEPAVRALLTNSEVEIRNKIVVFVISKHARETLTQLHADIAKEQGTAYLLEGSASYTFITQERYRGSIEKRLKSSIVATRTELALVMLKSPKEIEHTVGTVSFLTTLLAENSINIAEMLSSWTDTLFVISTKDVPRTIELLKF